MLLLLFGAASSGIPAATGHPGYRTGRGRTRGFPADDDAALDLLLEAEDRDVRGALEAYRSVLRRLL